MSVATPPATDFTPLDDYADLLIEYRTAQEARAYWETREAELKAAVLDALGDAQGGTIDGALVLRRRYVSGANRLDGGALKEAYPDIWAGFQRQSAGYDRLTFVGP